MARPSLRARSSAAVSSRRPIITTTTAPTTTPTTKKSKRIAKSTTFLSRVQDSGIQKSTSTRQQQQRRRRPHKKFPAAETMTDLRAALPSTAEDDDDDDEEWEGLHSEDDRENEREQTITKKGRRKIRRAKDEKGRIVLKSLKHKPGALKRKAILEGRERERFGRNLAEMVGTTRAGEDAREGETGDGESRRREQRWEALRAFIGGNLVGGQALGVR